MAASCSLGLHSLKCRARSSSEVSAEPDCPASYAEGGRQGGRRAAPLLGRAGQGGSGKPWGEPPRMPPPQHAAPTRCRDRERDGCRGHRLFQLHSALWRPCHSQQYHSPPPPPGKPIKPPNLRTTSPQTAQHRSKHPHRQHRASIRCHLPY